MLEGIFVEKVLTQEYIRPYPQQPQETSGYFVGSQAIYKYSLKSSDYPTIIIPDPLYDNDGGVIRPGFYELALSDSRDFLILLESKNPSAVSCTLSGIEHEYRLGEIIYIESAKVSRRYESYGSKYTRLSHVKFTNLNV